MKRLGLSALVIAFAINMTAVPIFASEGSYVENEIQDVMGINAYLDGEDVVISVVTKHPDPWTYTYGSYPISINYDIGYADEASKNTMQFNWDGTELHDGWYGLITNNIEKSEERADTETATMRVPLEWFASPNFSLSFGDYTASIFAGNGEYEESYTEGESYGNNEENEDYNEEFREDAPEEEYSEPEQVEEPVYEPVYSGINIDGNFSDWDAVSKFDLVEPDGDNNVEYVAWVIEDDFVYIYIKDSGTNSATWAGPNHNGKYAITTDLGRTLVLQLNNDGMVTGADGIISNHTGSQWEMAIPTGILPQNNGGLSFGLYLFDTTMSGYGNVQNVEASTGISYDGAFGDWDSFPHTEIQYATAGTNENVPDGEAAMYYDNNIYGHCFTQMQAHLSEGGGEFTKAISLLANDDWNRALYMRFVEVDESGNINWYPQIDNLENGSHEYYIFASDAWGTSENLGSLVDADVLYGRAIVNIQDTRQDVEWYVDPGKLAERYGIDETDMKTISCQYGRIGQQVITTAGTSTGPVAGAGICLLSAAVPFLKRKKITL